MRILLFFFALLLLPSVFALTCVYDEAPYLYLTTQPSAFCYSDNHSLSTDCYTYLDYGGDIFLTMPEPSPVEDYGVVNSYKMVMGSVAVEFGRRGLHDNAPVNATVLCGNETVTFNFTPSLVDYQELTEPQFFVQEHRYDLLWLLFALFFFFVIVLTFWRLLK